jgi:hypothetical protein
MILDIDFLRKYNKDIKLIDSLNNNESNKGILVSGDWKNVFQVNDFESRKNLVLELWNLHCKDILINTISYLKDNLIGIDLIYYSSYSSVLYTIKNTKGEILYYEGRLPKESGFYNLNYNYWNKIPSGVRGFYENVHDGFFYYASQSMGLSPIEDVINLNDLEWGIIEGLKEPLQIILDSTYGFFTNGMGTYVVIDLKNCKNDNAALWSAKKQPKYNLNFWNIVDEWIVLGFES